MKYLFFLLFISAAFCGSRYYVIEAVITKDFTKPGDDINKGDTIYYVIMDNLESGIWQQHYLIHGGVFKSEYIQRDTIINVGKSATIAHSYGLGYYGWRLEIDGDFKTFGIPILIKETIGLGYNLEAEGLLYDFYLSRPIAGIDFDIKPPPVDPILIDTVTIYDTVTILDTVTLHDTTYIQEECQIMNLIEKSLDNNSTPIIRYDVKGRRNF